MLILYTNAHTSSEHYGVSMLKGKKKMTRLAIVWCCSRERGCHFTVNRFRSKTVNCHQADTWWLLNLEEIRVCEALSAVLHCSLMQRCTHVLYWWHPPTLLPAHAHTNSDTHTHVQTHKHTHIRSHPPSVKMYEQTQSHRYSPCILSSRHASLTFSHCLNLRWIHNRTHTQRDTHIHSRTN